MKDGVIGPLGVEREVPSQLRGGVEPVDTRHEGQAAQVYSRQVGRGRLVAQYVVCRERTGIGIDRDRVIDVNRSADDHARRKSGDGAPWGECDIAENDAWAGVRNGGGTQNSHHLGPA